MRPILFALAVLLPTTAFAQLGGYGELARTTALTAADDYRIGKGYMDMMGWMYGEVDDPELVAWVDEVTRRIVNNSDRPDLVFNIRVVDDPTVNAAALPGGFMIVNKGLVDALTKDEVAFVIAHEISHVQLRHFATSMNMSKAMEVLDTGLAAQAASDKDAALDPQVEMQKMMTTYARHLELESDLYGMLYALRAGFPVTAGVDAMARMRDVVGEVPEDMKEVSTHPTFSQRIAELGEGIKTIEETHGLFDAGVSYARAGEHEPCVSAFQQFLTLFPKSASAWSNTGTCYLKGALKGVTGDVWHDDLPIYTRADVTVRAGLDKAAVARARDAFSKALAIDPNRDAALANLAVLARHEGDFKGAAELLAKAMELDPKYAGYQNNLGNVHAAQGDWKKADKAWDKALKLDSSATYAKANKAMGLVQRGKGKQSVKLWQELESDPQHSQQAHDQLVALGVKDASSSPVVTKEEAAAETEETLLVALIEALEQAEAEGTMSGGGLGEAGVEPEPAEPEVMPAGAEGKDAQVGQIKLGQSPADFKAALGEPTFEDAQEDGYYVYATWTEHGVSAVFIDDGATSIEAYEPCTSKTGQGIGLGSTEEQVHAAYGPPDEQYGDRNSGFLALSYLTRGTAFFIDGDGGVTGFSISTY